jgi:hypothetical protein
MEPTADEAAPRHPPRFSTIPSPSRVMMGVARLIYAEEASIPVSKSAMPNCQTVSGKPSWPSDPAVRCRPGALRIPGVGCNP